MAQGWRRTGRVGRSGSGVSCLGSSFIFWQSGNRSCGSLDFSFWCVSSFQFFQLFGGGFSVSSQSGRNIFQFFSSSISARFENTANFKFFGIFQQLLFFGTYFFKQITISDLRNRIVGVFHRQPDHRDHVSHDQDQVLSHLSPGYCAHTSQE